MNNDQPLRERDGPEPPTDLFPETVPDEQGLHKLPEPDRIDPGVEDGWRPSIDIAETETHYYFFVEAPGIRFDTISVELHGGILSIFVEKHLPQTEPGMMFHKVERDIGSSYRSFQVPNDALGTSPVWTWEKGVLKISLQRFSIVPEPESNLEQSCVDNFKQLPETNGVCSEPNELQSTKE